MSNTQRLERELKKKACKPYSTPLEDSSQRHGFRILGERLFLELKIFYYPVYSLSYERFHGGLFKNKHILSTTFLSSTSMVILSK